MPLEKSGSEKAKAKNFDEFRNGKTFARTASKYGKRVAERQMVAAVLSNQRKYAKKQKSEKVSTASRTKILKKSAPKRNTGKKMSK